MNNEFCSFYHDYYNQHVLCQISLIYRRSAQEKANISSDEALKSLKGTKEKMSSNLIAEVEVLGYRDDAGSVKIPSIPCRIGTVLEKAASPLIADVLQIGRKKGVSGYIGLLYGHDDLKCHLDLNKICSTHCAILASTGSGKSYLMGIIVEELIKRGAAIVIIDPHGEYRSLANINTNEDDLKNMDKFEVEPKAYPEKIVEFSPDIAINKTAQQLRFSDKDIPADDIIALTDIANSKAQEALLRNLIYFYKEKNLHWSLSSLISSANKSKSKAKFQLIEQLMVLKSLPIFDDPPIPLTEFVKRGKCVIINLRGVEERLQDLIVYRLARRLFEARKVADIPEMIFIVEEAQNYCPQEGKHKSCAFALQHLASEGRKFGLGLMIVSQRTAKVQKNVLSQCTTQFFLKMQNPQDLAAVANTIENYRKGMEDDLQHLPIGVCLVSGTVLSVPIFIKVRTRETEHGGKTIKIIKEPEEKDEEDIL
jgi:hypothetical protein